MVIRSRLFPFLVLILALLAGCSGSTDPQSDPADGLAVGAIDPAAGAIVLKAVDLDLPDGVRVRLELLGENLVLDDDGEHIDLSVSVRNAGDDPVAGPLLVWLDEFVPVDVTVANADVSDPPQPSMLPVMPWAYGFLYHDDFGDDGVLDPGEVSGARVWRFHTRDQGPFGFGLRVENGPHPVGPAISGRCFWDEDRDGVPDRNEPPLYPGVVHVVAPDGQRTDLRIDGRGGYVYELTAPGLYEVSYELHIETFAPIVFSTPNPRHVVITADADGNLRGFDAAHFGAHNLYEPGDPPVQFTDAPPDSLHRVFWELLGAEVDFADRLALDVGYSGCSPGHRFALRMSGGFMESSPVQVNLVPVHLTDEACQAAWQETIGFDLEPLRRRFGEAYDDDELVLNIVDFRGQSHRLLWNLAVDGDKPRD